MDMSREQRLDELEKAFSQVAVTAVESAEELARAEMARASRHFGFAQPTFRTSVRLRFSGEGIKGHDLDGGLAGSVIAGFVGAVNATGSQLKIPPRSTDLFLSPVVRPGSTILELFGAPAPALEKLDTEIDDTPVDAALDLLFRVLDGVNTAVGDASTIAPIEGVLGKRLFGLVKNLLENNVDLDVAWTRPRGHTTSTTVNRSTARALRGVLDTESVVSTERQESGVLTSISTSGQIGFTPRGRKVTIYIAAPNSDSEALRGLWAKDVEVTWVETVISHPQREEKKVKHELISVREPGSEQRA